MPELYEDLERIYNKLNERLDTLNNHQIEKAEQKKLVAWVKEVLNEMRICLQAIAENRLCNSS
jgi:hypothetical protein